MLYATPPFCTMPARLFALAALLLAQPAAAQFRVPASGSAERTAILDALRPTIAGYAGTRGAFVFAVDAIRVAGDNAFVYATPQQGGATLPALVARCPQADHNVAALLRRSGGRWRVVDWGTCATDVFYENWPTLYGVAPALLGFEGGGPRPTRPMIVEAPAGSDRWLALRSEPSVERGSRLAQIPHGARVDVIGCRNQSDTLDGRRGSWCRVRYNGRTGWAFDAYLRDVN